MKPDWILVANASQARLLDRVTGSPLSVVRAFHHPASRLRSSALGPDERGRERRAGAHGGAAHEAHVEPQRKEHQHFARELADYLEQSAQEGRFHRLHLFASSPFLGELKAHLGAATQRLLAGSLDLDLTAFGLDAIELRVHAALQGGAHLQEQRS